MGLELEDFNIPPNPNHGKEEIWPQVCMSASITAIQKNLSPSTTAIYQYQLLNKLSRALCPVLQLLGKYHSDFWIPGKKWAAALPKKKKFKKNPIFKGNSLETSGLLKILSHKEEKFVPTLQIRSICVFSENETFLSRCRFRIKQCHRPCS